ncbi:MAG TPA: alanine--glyoxylate aminotransferase family protein [Verrucomicrobiae bacterium]|nr:alanine--glyoxylate aminotransferase family protein [Verrucomicrobiae bacterium]
MPGIIKERLFTPGPTPLLLEAQLRALTMTLHHRTDAFRTLMRETLENLRYYFHTQNDVIVFASSGTGAMEGAVSNLLSPGERVLIGTAGKFGERWVQLAKAYGVEAVVVEAPYGHPVPIGEMKKHLETGGPFRAVLIQATESSTGVRNDVETLGKAVAALPECCFVVDAITGLGTTDLRPDEWGFDIMIGGSQKATMIPPGLAFASISEKASRAMEKSKLPRYYFDYAKERKSLSKGESSYTPATSLVVCLHDALNYIKELGRENLIANAALLAEATREAAVAMGLTNFAVSSPANAVTAINAPAGIESTKIVKEMRAQFGVILTDGQGSMKGHMFRIAHLGYYDFLDLVAVLGALEIVLQKVGHKVELGSGVRAAQNVYLRHSS